MDCDTDGERFNINIQENEFNRPAFNSSNCHQVKNKNDVNSISKNSFDKPDSRNLKSNHVTFKVNDEEIKTVLIKEELVLNTDSLTGKNEFLKDNDLDNTSAVRECILLSEISSADTKSGFQKQLPTGIESFFINSKKKNEKNISKSELLKQTSKDQQVKVCSKNAESLKPEKSNCTFSDVNEPPHKTSSTCSKRKSILRSDINFEIDPCDKYQQVHSWILDTMHCSYANNNKHTNEVLRPKSVSKTCTNIDINHDKTNEIVETQNVNENTKITNSVKNIQNNLKFTNPEATKDSKKKHFLNKNLCFNNTSEETDVKMSKSRYNDSSFMQLKENHNSESSTDKKMYLTENIKNTYPHLKCNHATQKESKKNITGLCTCDPNSNNMCYTSAKRNKQRKTKSECHQNLILTREDSSSHNLNKKCKFNQNSVSNKKTKSLANFNNFGKHYFIDSMKSDLNRFSEQNSLLFDTNHIANGNKVFCKELESNTSEYNNKDLNLIKHSQEDCYECPCKDTTNETDKLGYFKLEPWLRKGKRFLTDFFKNESDLVIPGRTPKYLNLTRLSSDSSASSYNDSKNCLKHNKFKSNFMETTHINSELNHNSLNSEHFLNKPEKLERINVSKCASYYYSAFKNLFSVNDINSEKNSASDSDTLDYPCSASKRYSMNSNKTYSDTCLSKSIDFGNSKTNLCLCLENLKNKLFTSQNNLQSQENCEFCKRVLYKVNRNDCSSRCTSGGGKTSCRQKSFSSTEISDTYNKKRNSFNPQNLFSLFPNLCSSYDICSVNKMKTKDSFEIRNFPENDSSNRETHNTNSCEKSSSDDYVLYESIPAEANGMDEHDFKEVSNKTEKTKNEIINVGCNNSTLIAQSLFGLNSQNASQKQAKSEDQINMDKFTSAVNEKNSSSFKCNDSHPIRHHKQVSCNSEIIKIKENVPSKNSSSTILLSNKEMKSYMNFLETKKDVDMGNLSIDWSNSSCCEACEKGVINSEVDETKSIKNNSNICCKKLHENVSKLQNNELYHSPCSKLPFKVKLTEYKGKNDYSCFKNLNKNLMNVKKCTKSLSNENRHFTNINGKYYSQSQNICNFSENTKFNNSSCSLGEVQENAPCRQKVTQNRHSLQNIETVMLDNKICCKVSLPHSIKKSLSHTLQSTVNKSEPFHCKNVLDNADIPQKEQSSEIKLLTSHEKCNFQNQEFSVHKNQEFNTLDGNSNKNNETIGNCFQQTGNVRHKSNTTDCECHLSSSWTQSEKESFKTFMNTIITGNVSNSKKKIMKELWDFMCKNIEHNNRDSINFFKNKQESKPDLITNFENNIGSNLEKNDKLNKSQHHICGKHLGKSFSVKEKVAPKTSNQIPFLSNVFLIDKCNFKMIQNPEREIPNFSKKNDCNLEVSCNPKDVISKNINRNKSETISQFTNSNKSKTKNKDGVCNKSDKIKSKKLSYRNIFEKEIDNSCCQVECDFHNKRKIVVSRSDCNLKYFPYRCNKSISCLDVASNFEYISQNTYRCIPEVHRNMLCENMCLPCTVNKLGKQNVSLSKKKLPFINENTGKYQFLDRKKNSKTEQMIHLQHCSKVMGHCGTHVYNEFCEFTELSSTLTNTTDSIKHSKYDSSETMKSELSYNVLKELKMRKERGQLLFERSPRFKKSNQNYLFNKEEKINWYPPFLRNIKRGDCVSIYGENFFDNYDCSTDEGQAKKVFKKQLGWMKKKENGLIIGDIKINKLVHPNLPTNNCQCCEKSFKGTSRIAREKAANSASYKEKCCNMSEKKTPPKNDKFLGVKENVVTCESKRKMSPCRSSNVPCRNKCGKEFKGCECCGFHKAMYTCSKLIQNRLNEKTEKIEPLELNASKEFNAKNKIPNKPFKDEAICKFPITKSSEKHLNFQIPLLNECDEQMKMKDLSEKNVTKDFIKCYKENKNLDNSEFVTNDEHSYLQRPKDSTIFNSGVLNDHLRKTPNRLYFFQHENNSQLKEQMGPYKFDGSSLNDYSTKNVKCSPVLLNRQDKCFESIRVAMNKDKPTLHKGKVVCVNMNNSPHQCHSLDTINLERSFSTPECVSFINENLDISSCQHFENDNMFQTRKRKKCAFHNESISLMSCSQGPQTSVVMDANGKCDGIQSYNHDTQTGFNGNYIRKQIKECKEIFLNKITLNDEDSRCVVNKEKKLILGERKKENPIIGYTSIYKMMNSVNSDSYGQFEETIILPAAQTLNSVRTSKESNDIDTINTDFESFRAVNRDIEEEINNYLGVNTNSEVKNKKVTINETFNKGNILDKPKRKMISKITPKIKTNFQKRATNLVSSKVNNPSQSKVIKKPEHVFQKAIKPLSVQSGKSSSEKETNQTPTPLTPPKIQSDLRAKSCGSQLAPSVYSNKNVKSMGVVINPKLCKKDLKNFKARQPLGFAFNKERKEKESVDKNKKTQLPFRTNLSTMKGNLTDKLSRKNQENVKKKWK